MMICGKDKEFEGVPVREEIQQLHIELYEPIAWDVQVPNTEVFHYTSADGLLGIIRSGQPWATSV